MSTTSEGLNFDLSKWRLRSEMRSRKRMKITLKLSAEQSEAVNNFMGVVKPDDVSTDDFFMTMFYRGLQETHNDLLGMTQKFAEENAEELAASGIEVIEDPEGGVRLTSSESTENVSERLGDPEE